MRRDKRATAKVVPLRRAPTKHVEERLSDLLNRVREDAREDAREYARDTEVPEGGE